ncbi:hypothetical protein PR001_g29365 [Phytophthora rubi]|uniref:Uncharacterized protein n=1 Tax=Phytophthora rubi TaxID=129364 RepID=A0A6A3H2K0_9STRA|nr:hypothetical protein PR002_g29645 [Phytophthora rubi]KAE8963457.1 hypothetical protein PR001_g29365 [Phytophthora rubi]
MRFTVFLALVVATFVACISFVAVSLRCLQDWVPTSRHTACAWLARASKICS